jgi:hypothetical protein
MGRLAVELYGVPIGQLEFSDEDTRAFDFRASPEGLSAFSLHSISSSLLPRDGQP